MTDAWRKSSYSGNGGDCVEVVDHDNHLMVRDSKNPEGAKLAFKGRAASDAIDFAIESLGTQKIADGVWFLAGGSHNSVLVEYPTYLAMIEAPLDEARSLAVISEARKLAPNKPIKYLINTHHHFDH